MTRIACISFTTADPARLEAFYRTAFGFSQIDAVYYRGDRFARLMGLAGAEARGLLLRLGRQDLELLAFARPGRPYPADIAGNDPRFQHIAIVARDMREAYARLSQCHDWTPITTGGPQRLPAGSGGVTAFKFRDPDGHPLELLAFPPGAVPSAWREQRENGPCLGIDHSAITVTDSARIIDFYQMLGFSVTGGSLNRGPEQQRLDGVADAIVEVTALASAASPPHLELLCYRAAAQRPAAPPDSNDIAAVRLVLETDEKRPMALIRDPDGHALFLRRSSPVTTGK